MPFLSSTSRRWVCCWAQVPPQAGGGHEKGSHSLWYDRAGMEFERFYSSLWAEGCVMSAVGSPKAQAGSRASPRASSQEEQLRVSLAEIRHRVSISDQPYQERRL